jgi:transposase InsO family protein
VVTRALGKRDTEKEEKTYKVKYLYEVFGISKQAYHKRIKTRQTKELQQQAVIDEVVKIRTRMPQTGTCKLYKHLQPVLPDIKVKIGRDGLFDLLRNRGMLIRKSKQFHVTTDSKHSFYTSPNSLKDMEITHAEQAFVSDITYLKTDEGHAYLALVTDVYSKQLMGWSLDDNMKVSMVKEALIMANDNRIYKHQNIIHHSDRGRQYCCPEYIECAKQMGFEMSTTQQSDPYENAVAERINGILKYEFAFRKTLPNIEVARKMMKQAAEIYNKERLHWSLDLKTPEQVHGQYNQHKHKSYAIKDKGKKVTSKSSCEDGNELCSGATRIVPKS